jgi:hypothetical protein
LGLRVSLLPLPSKKFIYDKGDATMHSPTHLSPISSLIFLLLTWDPSPPQEKGDGGDGWENAKKKKKKKHFPYNKK